MKAKKNVGASVRARLLNRARADKLDFNLMLTRFALERLLYRLGVSTWSNEFLLKGALLFDLWFDQPQRPTRDIDLLGFGPAGMEHLAAVFQDVCVQICDDGMIFDQASVMATEIRKDANYEGVRVTLRGVLDGARCAIQIDVGYGDAVTPAAESVSFPVVLADMPAPQLRAYPVYTVVAEKYQAMVSLGIANTRMKDYFDLWILALHASIDRAILNEAIKATFERRGTPIPIDTPLGLSATFATDQMKQQQWKAFLSKNKLKAPDLVEVVEVLVGLVGVAGQPGAAAVVQGP
ncbi:nucleotidyl transferase AbiEii/AbiGii toxin family protein [Massilia glaciei]|uniref:Nucleotidyl transferase AbiEii/AbiGii toxin family protein n=1 Tax=Massilia glaciei TaxID=1524097 RepID=A0A2U2HP86_9BURK|nr:nucleotidyl transferase AbiEii/AbiGii toxin family protein [Massilia glaciei]PWF49321.1 nucleotidyl transferase AbiEii/AbiGii toxin family protein [Massilia glaciei]